MANSGIFGVEFYPTPRPLIEKMWAKVTNKNAKHFLEPQAGKGDIADFIHSKHTRDYRYDERARDGRRPRSADITVDCIECQPELLSILRGQELNVVGYDWLEYEGVCFYDVIMMNPPFSNANKHLWKAWEFMYGGEIVCVYPASKLLHPSSAMDRQILELIAAHGSCEIFADEFRNAERKTLVDVAIVYLKKEAKDDRFDIFANLSEEKAAGPDLPEELGLMLPDPLGNMEHFYNMANEEMSKAIQHLRRCQVYLDANHIGIAAEHLAPLAMSNMNAARAFFAKQHRTNAWASVFATAKFHKWLDKKQRDELVAEIAASSQVPFTAENIKGTLQNIVLSRGKFYEKSVANVFDELTKHFADNTSGPPIEGGTSGHRGWSSNASYKVNQKIVFPYGCSWDKDWGFKTRWGGCAVDIYNDLDRVLCVQEGLDFEDFRKLDPASSTIENALEAHFRTGDWSSKTGTKYCDDKTCESFFFDIRYFQKGTVHLIWKFEKVRERFNIKAAAGKRWIGEDTATIAKQKREAAA